MVTNDKNAKPEESHIRVAHARRHSAPGRAQRTAHLDQAVGDVIGGSTIGGGVLEGTSVEAGTSTGSTGSLIGAGPGKGLGDGPGTGCGSGFGVMCIDGGIDCGIDSSVARDLDPDGVFNLASMRISRMTRSKIKKGLAPLSIGDAEYVNDLCCESSPCRSQRP